MPFNKAIAYAAVVFPGFLAAFAPLAFAQSITAGMSADFTVLDANPLEDITNTRRIAAAVLRGTPVDRAQPAR